VARGQGDIEAAAPKTQKAMGAPSKQTSVGCTATSTSKTRAELGRRIDEA
jgi:hypothetical protein